MTTYLGLDLGGTNIKAGLVDAEGEVLGEFSIETEAESGPDRVIANMTKAAEAVCTEAETTLDTVRAIGIGAPGPLDINTGVIRNAPNLPGFRDVPIRDRIAQATGCRAVLENDANAAAMGEFWVGAAANNTIQHMVMLTLGTGVGGGIVINGEVLHGATGIAGEVGHMIIYPNGRQCGCGQRGCVEAYASASNTARRAIEGLEGGADSGLRKLYDGDILQITAKDVFDAAGESDAFAKRIVNETVDCLALTCVTLARIFDPQMIVFAGGMIHAGERLFGPMREAYDRLTWKMTEDGLELAAAQLGSRAGFIGAAGVARYADEHDRLPPIPA